MADQRGNAPIIIKRKKIIASGGHHGGAWKVAYADFVTAMMAFFMLMWLLNATTEKQRKGIADYFNPTIPINRVSGGGEHVFGGDSVFSENVQPKNGTGASAEKPSTERQAKGNTGVSTEDINQKQSEDEAFAAIAEKLLGNSGESLVADSLLTHVHTRVTDEGLIIELFDFPNRPKPCRIWWIWWPSFWTSRRIRLQSMAKPVRFRLCWQVIRDGICQSTVRR